MSYDDDDEEGELLSQLVHSLYTFDLGPASIIPQHSSPLLYIQFELDQQHPHEIGS